MRPPVWHPPVEPAPAEQTVIVMLALSLTRAADQSGESVAELVALAGAAGASGVRATRCRVGC
jgi:hypothetical protein